MARGWLRMPIASGLILALLVGNGVAAQGVRCLMPGCKSCAPKPASKPEGCCPEPDPTPKPCCCIAPGGDHPEGVLAGKVDLPPLVLMTPAPAPIALGLFEVVAASPPETRTLGPPGDDFHRAPCGRAPPAS